MTGFELNLEPLSDNVTATLNLGKGESVDCSIKDLWEAIGEVKLDMDNPNYITELQKQFKKVIGRDVSKWSVEVIHNATTQWVTNLYKKK